MHFGVYGSGVGVATTVEGDKIGEDKIPLLISLEMGSLMGDSILASPIPKKKKTIPRRWAPRTHGRALKEGQIGLEECFVY